MDRTGLPGGAPPCCPSNLRLLQGCLDLSRCWSAAGPSWPSGLTPCSELSTASCTGAVALEATALVLS